jgi:hypothetical protein
MSWNGYKVIDLDAHIQERADQYYHDYLDPAYREQYQTLCDAIAKQEAAGLGYSLFGRPGSVIEGHETGRPLGVQDTFGLSQRAMMTESRKAFRQAVSMPLALDRLDTHYILSPGHVPNLKRMPREVLAEGRYFHGMDSWERSVEFCVEELGEDMWLFASDWPHGDTAWPETVEQLVERPKLTESAKRKMLGENAMRLCPRLRTA